ncbi:TPA: nucleotidyltransferase domain-containing protein [Candidatus Woesearchaeota archaeon]|nr:nucleotidyltransferase domain-containing protein [Candidatus Woesearchaeota archaeon]
MELQRIVDQLRKINEVQAIYLFGSQNQGRAKPYSDTDLCVVTSYPLRRSVKEKILAHNAKKIDLSLFHSLPLNIQYRIVNTGKALFIRNHLEDHRLKVQVTIRYLDFKPLLNRVIEKAIAL